LIGAHLLDHPYTIISLSFFSARYQSAKSSISEDLSIVKKTFYVRDVDIKTKTITVIPGNYLKTLRTC
jgi:hypothetical protein